MKSTPILILFVFSIFIITITRNVSAVLMTHGRRPDVIRWDGVTRFNTIEGFPCVTPCEKRDKPFYWCYTHEIRAGWTDSHRGWGRCSPKPGLDQWGHTCDTECRWHHFGYYWCMVDNKRNWERCSLSVDTPEPVSVAKYKTRFGYHCLSPCEKGNYGHHWCTTEGPPGSWDYCSVIPGHDVYGRKCANRCDHHEGRNYTWCNLENEQGWSYCGTMEFDSVTEFTYLGSKCVTPCRLSLDGTNTTCYDATRIPRQCSIVMGVASNNKDCVGTCGLQDYQGEVKPFNWCWTNPSRSQWSYCSKSREDRQGRQVDNIWVSKEYYHKSQIRLQLTRSRSLDNIIGLRDDQGNDQVTFFEKLERSGRDRQYSIRTKDNQEMLEWFTGTLQEWRKRGYPISQRRGNTRLASSGQRSRNGFPAGVGVGSAVRLDQQSRYQDENGEEYVNLMMVVAGLTRRQNQGRSTVLAEVQVSVQTVIEDPEEVIRQMLVSLHEGYAVHIGRFRYLEDRGNNGTSKRLWAEEQLLH